jgi:hypothetical protein
MLVADRLGRIDWTVAERDLAERPYARLGSVLTADECRRLAALYTDDSRFRSRVDMGRHRFGVGEYKYFNRPLPDLVAELRRRTYPPLARIANRWQEALGSAERFPEAFEGFERRCHEAGQRQPTPLLLRYEAGGYNCLHQDLYGDLSFPLQLVAFLSEPGRDYTGGEFLLVVQRPRAQSIGEAITARQGELMVFANRFWPARGARGYYRTAVRHGVSRLHSGTRYTLGVIFHDAT